MIAAAFLVVLLLVAFQVAVAQWSSLLQNREAKRRLQHAWTGQALVWVSYYIPVYEIGIPALLLGCVGIWYLRFYQQDLYRQAFGPLLRPSELDDDVAGSRRRRGQLPGAFYFLLGTTLTVSLFPLPVARYAVLCLSWADPMAAWVGQSRHWYLAKIHASASVGGCLGCFVTAVVIGYVCLIIREEEGESWMSVLAGALACTLAEASPVGNDNLLIPLATAVAIQLARYNTAGYGN